MYAVIFKAEIKALDEQYFTLAARMRELAIDQYGCLEFHSCTEGANEIAISYWQNKEQIRAWKNNIEHQQAQQLGKAKWYTSYKVQIVEIIEQYDSNANG